MANVSKGLSLSTGHVEVDRASIYEDAITAYTRKPNLANNFKIIVCFSGESAVDFGGVSRDFFSGFWEAAYKKMFDGAALLTPACHSEVNIDDFEVLGKILSHGYLSCGFLPTRLAFPVIAFILLGLSTNISQSILVNSFSEFLGPLDRKAISTALEAKEFTMGIKSNVITILSRFGCREVPTPHNLVRLLCSLARHHFKSQPFAALSAMHAGVPKKHKPFWQAIGVEELRELYDAMTANPEKILEILVEPDYSNINEQRVFGYLQQFVGEMKLDEAKRFLRFVTGSSVVTGEEITLSFNALSGAARCPLAHTCTNLLDLPYTYSTYLEFVEEFTVLLANEDYCWQMNSY